MGNFVSGLRNPSAVNAGSFFVWHTLSNSFRDVSIQGRTSSSLAHHHNFIGCLFGPLLIPTAFRLFCSLFWSFPGLLRHGSLALAHNTNLHPSDGRRSAKHATTHHSSRSLLAKSFNGMIRIRGPRGQLKSSHAAGAQFFQRARASEPASCNAHDGCGGPGVQSIKSKAEYAADNLGHCAVFFLRTQ